MDLNEARDIVVHFRGCGAPLTNALVWAVAEVERLTRENEHLRGELERLRDVVCEEDCESIQRVLDEDSKGPTPCNLSGDGPLCTFRWRTSGRPEDEQDILYVATFHGREVPLCGWYDLPIDMLRGGRHVEWKHVLRWVPASEVTR
jgi:hypothetical protein